MLNIVNVLPFHIVILFTVTPPAVVKLPPMYTCVSSNAYIAYTMLLADIPVLNVVNVLPFHIVILFTVTPPAVVKLPPMYTCVASNAYIAYM